MEMDLKRRPDRDRRISPEANLLRRLLQDNKATLKRAASGSALSYPRRESNPYNL